MKNLYCESCGKEMYYNEERICGEKIKQSQQKKCDHDFKETENGLYCFRCGKSQPQQEEWEERFDKEINFINPTTEGYKIIKQFIIKEKRELFERMEELIYSLTRRHIRGSEWIDVAEVHEIFNQLTN